MVRVLAQTMEPLANREGSRPIFTRTAYKIVTATGLRSNCPSYQHIRLAAAPVGRMDTVSTFMMNQQMSTLLANFTRTGDKPLSSPRLGHSTLEAPSPAMRQRISMTFTPTVISPINSETQISCRSRAE